MLLNVPRWKMMTCLSTCTVPDVFQMCSCSSRCSCIVSALLYVMYCDALCGRCHYVYNLLCLSWHYIMFKTSNLYIYYVATSLLVALFVALYCPVHIFVCHLVCNTLLWLSFVHSGIPILPVLWPLFSLIW